MSTDEGGRQPSPSAPSIATVAYRCCSCDWMLLYPLTDSDLRDNRGVRLWVRCDCCNNYAFLAGVQPGGGVFENYETVEDAAQAADRGIRWEKA